MKRVGIIGSGNVGSTLAFSIATRNICNEILIKDLREDFMKAISLDISQASIINESSSTLKAITNAKDFKDCDIIIITAGVARTPNMSREDLLLKNANILISILDEIVKFNKNAIFITVTNPLDALTYLAIKYTKLDRKRVFGMAGELDSARFKYYINEALNFKAKNIKAQVIGSHSNSMVPLVSNATVDGKKLEDVFTKEKIDEIIENTKNGGATIVELLKSGSAYFAPAIAVANMCEAILNDSKKEFICSVELCGEYGYNELTLGVPVVLGKDGIEAIIEQNISQVEKSLLDISAKSIKDNINILKELL